jgi:hypothetical protein
MHALEKLMSAGLQLDAQDLGLVWQVVVFSSFSSIYILPQEFAIGLCSFLPKSVISLS